MTRFPTEREKSRFEAICSSLSGAAASEISAGIGTYNEKRLHRAIKNFICEDESCLEVKVCGSVADVLSGGVISEIQTGSFSPLKKKLAAYLADGGYDVQIIFPIITQKRIVRIDPKTGEVLRSKLSPKKESPTKLLPELIYLCEHLTNERLHFVIFAVNVEEHRYSDEVHRYRKSGRYDSESFPVSLEYIVEINSADDLLSLLSDELTVKGTSFTAAEFSKATKLRGRRAYAALGALTAAGLLKKEKSGREAARFLVG